MKNNLKTSLWLDLTFNCIAISTPTSVKALASFQNKPYSETNISILYY